MRQYLAIKTLPYRISPEIVICPEREREALRLVEGRLRAGSIRSFDMNDLHSCVGHHVGRAMGLSTEEALRYVIHHCVHGRGGNRRIASLYFPRELPRRVTQREAADQVAIFLLGGRPWSNARQRATLPTTAQEVRP